MLLEAVQAALAGDTTTETLPMLKPDPTFTEVGFRENVPIRIVPVSAARELFPSFSSVIWLVGSAMAPRYQTPAARLAGTGIGPAQVWDAPTASPVIAQPHPVSTAVAMEMTEVGEK